MFPPFLSIPQYAEKFRRAFIARIIWLL